MISYIVVFLPEIDLQYLYKENDDFVLRGMEDIANERLKIAGINLEEVPSIKEPEQPEQPDEPKEPDENQTVKKDNDYSKKDDGWSPF